MINNIGNSITNSISNIMSVYFSIEELLTVAPFIEPSVLIRHVLPQLDDENILNLHRSYSLTSLLGEYRFQEHLMGRSLSLIAQLDSEECVDRSTLYKLAREYHRPDIMTYAKQQEYSC